MKTEYYKIELDLSEESPYAYEFNSKIPTTIKFGRQHDGKFQEGTIVDSLTNKMLHNIIFSLKNGYTVDAIMTYLELENMNNNNYPA